VLKSIQNPSDLSEPMGTPAPSNKIFIVHGHNDALKYQTAHSLQSAGLDVTILHEAAHGGGRFPKNSLITPVRSALR
jgi:Predicted nucleotide-binding protein containing TIR-like domain